MLLNRKAIVSVIAAGFTPVVYCENYSEYIQISG